MDPAYQQVGVINMLSGPTPILTHIDLTFEHP